MCATCAQARPWRVTGPPRPPGPAADPSLPHQIRLTQAGTRTRVKCNCGAQLGMFPPGDAPAMIAAYRAHDAGTMQKRQKGRAQ